MAKELAMVERNEIGRAIRKYFIQTEKDFRSRIQFKGSNLQQRLFDLLLEEQQSEIKASNSGKGLAARKVDKQKFKARRAELLKEMQPDLFLN